ncbi:phytoene/squalene synthase family protein [Cognatilysobacter lacus]|uniref:Phytoene/squalene synthase family protein n=1 Tax=Cognatilysobacter lacus TaxID=1643323 RepID=A0A5D8ZAF9_9GAMM|nr:phytoene/squalene synthase family protein [Lysobacter lacus]TZF91112.1 phytoene/squalene synthase family protein [Lysobacter lacus]
MLARLMDESRVDAGADVAAFVAKWRGAWPEWALAEIFLPAAQRPLVDAWRALQYEWQEAAWGGTDALPGQAKLQWWIEELDGWSQGRRRHPLGALLQRQPAPWRELALSLPSLAASRNPPQSVDDAWQALAPVSAAVAQVDAALFAAPGDPRAVAACWLQARLARHADAAVPLDLQVDMPRARGNWARILLSAWPSPHGIAAARAIELALARGRLSRGDASKPLSPWTALWTGWRAARA